MSENRRSSPRRRDNDTRSPHTRSPHTRNPLYRRDGPLSPLRSPANRKEAVVTRNSPYKRQTPRTASRSDSASSSTPSWADLTDEFERTTEEVNVYKAKLNSRQKDRQSLVTSTDDSSSTKEVEIETDEDVLMRRQKQIDYGKNNPSYENYLINVPRMTRQRGKHPVTPNKFRKCSRRAWDGQVKCWKLDVHKNSDGSVPVTPSSSVSSRNTTPHAATPQSETDAQPDPRTFRKQLFGQEGNDSAEEDAMQL